MDYSKLSPTRNGFVSSKNQLTLNVYDGHSLYDQGDLWFTPDRLTGTLNLLEPT